MDDRLALSVTHADGRITRWGPDEVDAGSIPSDLQFSTAMPGGYRDLSCNLLRRIDLDYPDQGLFDNVRAYGPGNQTAWDGRFTQFPRSHGQGFSITPGAVGWSAHLRDDPSFREIYIDRDLSRWQGNSVQRQLALGVTWHPQTDPQVVADPVTGEPALLQELSGQFGGASGAINEARYDAGPGLTVGAVQFEGVANGTGGSATWNAGLYSADDDLFTVGLSVIAADNNAAARTLATHTFGTPQRVALHSLAYLATTASEATRKYFLKHVAVIGGHGLTIQGTAPDIGLYASDIISDIVSRAAPMLSTEDVQTSDFVIPHLVFTDPVTAEDAIGLVNSYHLWEWGVYDDRVFFYRPPDNERLVWEARLDRGAFLDLEGDTAEQVYNGVFVTYTDAAGTRKSAGPGGSGADLETSTLADTSDTNPVNAHGIPRRWAILNISQPTDETGAQQLGYTWLGEHSLPQRRGNLTLTGSATHPTEGDVPVWRIKAGDSVRISDHPADVPRRIISTSYSHGTRSISLSLDNTSFKLDAIIERALGVQMVGVL